VHISYDLNLIPTFGAFGGLNGKNHEAELFYNGITTFQDKLAG
jgi:hypothetical protein